MADMPVKKPKGKWMPVRHTEDQQHPDWVLYWQQDEGTKEGKGQQPRAVAECERRNDGRWLWRVQAEEIGGKLHSGFEPSADTAMRAAEVYILERMKGANAVNL